MNRFEDTFNTQIMASPEGNASTLTNAKPQDSQSPTLQNPNIDIAKGVKSPKTEAMLKKSQQTQEALEKEQIRVRIARNHEPMQFIDNNEETPNVRMELQAERPSTPLVLHQAQPIEKPEIVQKIFKLTVVLIIIGILASAQLNPGFLPMNKPDCLEDNFFEWTKALNLQLKDLPTANKVLTVILGLAMDALAITCFYRWVVDLHRSWTFPLALCSVYALKILIQFLFLMAVPTDAIWEFPGMYSLMMQPYGHRNDYFFCHSLGFMVIIFFEFKATECVKLAFGTLMTIFFAAIFMLITRATYSIDILGGLLFGHYFWILSERISWVLDFEWFHQPFHLRHPMFQSKCGKCLEPINTWAVNGSQQSIGYEQEVFEKHLKGDKIVEGQLPLYEQKVLSNDIKKEHMNKEVNNNKTKAAINSAVSRSDEVIEIEENDKSLLIV